MDVLNSILNFIITDIFGQAAIFLALIAAVGLILLKKPFGEIVRSIMITAIGYFALQAGVNVLSDCIGSLSTAFTVLMPQAAPMNEIGAAGIMEQYGTQIGIVMIIAFAINILFARFTKWKSIFLTGHMLYWFPFIFIAAGVDAGMTGFGLIALAAVFTSIYMIVSPNLMRPLVKQVTGNEDFTIGHPTTVFSVIGGYVAKALGDKSKSTEDIKFPKGLSFLREVTIIGSIVFALVYIVLSILLSSSGHNPAEVWGYSSSLFAFIFSKSLSFGAGVTILFMGVRMVISEIVPAFRGFSEKLVPGAIPALDCPILFPFGPNALIIGFVVALITSVITLILTYGMFPTIIVPLLFACFFEAGTAAIVGNAMGGIRGCIISAFISGVLMIFLVGFGSYFFGRTINGWMLVFGGQDFSLWGIIEGSIARLFAG